MEADVTAWLMIAAGDDRIYSSNDGYDDNPSTYYSWDDTVPNHSKPSTGDQIVLWDKKTLIGISVIERIEQGTSQKLQRRCSRCNKLSLIYRKTTKDYRCQKCKTVVDPVVEHKHVVTYRSHHASAWTDLHGVLDGTTLRNCCVSPKSIHSIRHFNKSLFEEAIAKAGYSSTLGVVNSFETFHEPSVPYSAAGTPRSGFSMRRVRVRRGQGSFRKNLLAKYQATCAFSGVQPISVLEAAHLYSYAATGEHHSGGGLLLRRDLHRLFDLGLLRVSEDLTILIDPSLHNYETYAAFHGRPLQVEVSSATRRWFRLHHQQHKPTNTDAE